MSEYDELQTAGCNGVATMLRNVDQLVKQARNEDPSGDRLVTLLDAIRHEVSAAVAINTALNMDRVSEAAYLADAARRQSAIRWVSTQAILTE